MDYEGLMEDLWDMYARARLRSISDAAFGGSVENQRRWLDFQAACLEFYHEVEENL